MIKVVNYKTYRKKKDDVVINIMQNRGSVLGNPYYRESRDIAILKFKIWLRNHIKNETPKIINELKNIKSLSDKGTVYLECCCAPLKCHGDAIKDYIEWLF